ncbi:hypothetical protein [Cognatishimia sp. F0-27]|uniref:hypothetical protein n=1 Tax=Cognatishimia sp. F0-27 TaxID=2816855 RepID=UPI001D0C0876|nr:hypothetical protein [Cognatishimia sp. F0-27]MCC1492588.1 hypothetical protein [Cognatishimia sp. F0-27]
MYETIFTLAVLVALPLLAALAARRTSWPFYRTGVMVFAVLWLGALAAIVAMDVNCTGGSLLVGHSACSIAPDMVANTVTERALFVLGAALFGWLSLTLMLLVRWFRGRR